MSGNIALLPKYQVSLWIEPYPMSSPATMMELLRTELELRENTQRKVALREDTQGLLKLSGTHDISIRNQTLWSNFSNLVKEHRILEREWWKVRGVMNSDLEDPLDHIQDLPPRCMPLDLKDKNMLQEVNLTSVWISTLSFKFSSVRLLQDN